MKKQKNEKNSYKLQEGKKPYAVDYQLNFNSDSVLMLKYERSDGRTEYDLFHYDNHTDLMSAHTKIKKTITKAA